MSKRHTNPSKEARVHKAQIAQWPRDIDVPDDEVSRLPGDTYIALSGHLYSVAVVRENELSACGWAASNPDEVKQLTQEQ